MTGIVCWGTDQQQAVFIWLGLWFGGRKGLSAQDKAFQHKSHLGARRPPRIEEKIQIIRELRGITTWPEHRLEVQHLVQDFNNKPWQFHHSNTNFIFLSILTLVYSNKLCMMNPRSQVHH